MKKKYRKRPIVIEAEQFFMDVDQLPAGVIDGGGLFCGRTYELMYGATVRILIPAGTCKEDAVRLLKKLTAWIERSSLETVTTPPVLMCAGEALS